MSEILLPAADCEELDLDEPDYEVPPLDSAQIVQGLCRMLESVPGGHAAPERVAQMLGISTWDVRGILRGKRALREVEIDRLVSATGIYPGGFVFAGLVPLPPHDGDVLAAEVVGLGFKTDDRGRTSFRLLYPHDANDPEFRSLLNPGG